MQIMPRPGFLKIIMLLMILGGAVLLTLFAAIPRLLDLNAYRDQLTGMLQRQLNRPVQLGNSHFTWARGPAFAFDDALIREPDGSREFLSARRISFRLALLPLLNKQIRLREVIVEQARITLLRQEDGTLSIDDLLKADESGYELRLRGFKLRNSTLHWHDRARGVPPLSLTFSDINLSLDRLARDRKSVFKLTAVLDGSSPNRISTAGSFKLPAAGRPLRETDLDLKIELQRLEYWRAWSYLARRLPFAAPGGTVSLNLSMKGRWQDLKAKVALQAMNPVVVWPSVFRGPAAASQVKITCALAWNADRLALTGLQIGLDNFLLNGSVRLSGLGGADPAITAEAVTEPFDYLKVRQYIPFGIIADDAAEFIEKRIRGGTFRLTTGTLNGRFSQLAAFGIGDNANSLYIRGTAEQAVIQYGEKTPTFRHIKGNLEMKGRHFNLIGMSGTFGDAPFTLDGSITEYATEGVPSHYPFTMNISPRPAEVAWLAGHAGVEELQFRGTTTTLKLQGDGPSSAYRVSGEWLLNQAGYDYPGIVRKPAGMPNTLNFSAVLGRDETRFTSVSYQLPPLKVSGHGLLRYSGPAPYLSFDLESNRFHLSEQLPVVPDWQHYHLNGTVQAHLLGAGDPRSVSTMQFNGTVQLSDFSCRPHPKLHPVTNIDTRIELKGHALETSGMAIRYGSTPLQVRGRINDLGRPVTELYVTSPRLNPVDFGYPAADKPPLFSQFSAHLGFGDGLLTIRNVSARLPKSIFSASGTVRPGEVPDFNLRIAATHLDIDEIIPLLAPSQPADAPRHAAPVPFHLEAHLTAEKGSYRNAPLSNLSSFFKTEGGVLHLHGLKTTFLDGRLSLQGRLTRTAGSPPRWNLSFLLEQAQAGAVLEILGIGREVKGLTTARGTLIAAGDDLASVKRTVNGSLSLSVDRGTLRRFNSLSKVISILNVSQLLRFSLPDMARDGMPFNRITATIGVKDGVLKSEDFFIDSNVMHVTMVGTIDLVKESLDLLIGVQPLQTVDTIVSRIPVVGWILSGGDGSLITTYFKAQGGWENPEVTAIPVQTMASGTLDIFGRIFELPVRLFTDTGQVLLGRQKERPKAGEKPAQ